MHVFSVYTAWAAADLSVIACQQFFRTHRCAESSRGRKNFSCRRSEVEVGPIKRQEEAWVRCTHFVCSDLCCLASYLIGQRGFSQPPGSETSTWSIKAEKNIRRMGAEVTAEASHHLWTAISLSRTARTLFSSSSNCRGVSEGQYGRWIKINISRRATVLSEKLEFGLYSTVKLWCHCPLPVFHPNKEIFNDNSFNNKWLRSFHTFESACVGWQILLFILLLKSRQFTASSSARRLREKGDTTRSRAFSLQKEDER